MSALSPGAERLLAALAAERDAVAAEISERIRAEIPEYAGHAEVEDNTSRHLRAFLDWSDGGEPPELAFERDITAVRVRTGFALLPTLGAYRIGEIALWEWLLRAVERPGAGAALDDVREVAARWFAYGELARNVTIESYLAQDRRRTAAEAADRRDLLDDLVHGRVSGVEAETRLRRLGCAVGRRNYVAVVSLPASPLATAHERTQAVAVRLESSLAAAGGGLRPFVALTHSQVTAVAPGDLGGAAVADAVRAAIGADPGGRVRAGVSLPVAHVGDVRTAYRQALAAADMSTPDRPVTALGALSAFDYLLETGAQDVLQLAPPAVLAELARGDAYAHELVETISVYLQSGMRAREAAEHLHIHTNTIYYRLSRIERLFGIDTRDHSQLLDLLIYVRMFRRLGARTRTGPAPDTDEAP
ncbi:PucR family transcriptional regulator [Actinomadura atramentaria]|uniref:PucR family transcriptional regulator n=1 Tax=Actinomadura atramentaria TaxID=1990 RepID=UPI00036553A8|nr:helix-turn-helix domain-containing protein [Actinomadura atramentaria]